jgi:hypothetical protein
MKTVRAILIVLSGLLIVLPGCSGVDKAAEAEGGVSDYQELPLLRGAKISCWDGNKRVCGMEIGSLELVPKTWGPFTLADQKDIRGSDCVLKVDGAALVSHIQQLGDLLTQIAKPRGSGPGEEIDTRNSSAPPSPMVFLPPDIKFQGFSCVINQPSGEETTLTAHQAKLDLPQRGLILLGRVRVTSSQGELLAAEEVSWTITSQELFASGPYTAKLGKNQQHGQDGQFLLTDGRLEKQKTPGTATPPQPCSLPPFPYVQLMKKGGNNAMSALLPLAIMQAQGAAQGVIKGGAPEGLMPPLPPCEE